MTKVAGLPVEPVVPAPARTSSATFGGAFHAPRSLDELLALRAQKRGMLLMAGATDLGLLASRARKPPAAIIHVAHVPELRAIGETRREITIGAAATYAEAMPMLIAQYPALRTYLARLGSRQIRSMGTIGGNIGTASPIGDMPPVLLALETRLTLVSVRGSREVALEDFFLGYRKTALAADEVIQSLTLPKLRPGEVFFCDKLSKRRDQDISTVAAGYRLHLKNGKIEDVRMGFGGMAATPLRPAHVEQCSEGPAVFRGDLRNCRRGGRKGLPADRRLARFGGLPAHRRRQPAAPALLAHRRAAARGRGRSAMRVRFTPPQRHDSALKHVTGQALYIDDIPEPPGTLHAALVLSSVASGRLRKLHLAVAAAAPGVVAVFAAGDIPGRNNIARSAARKSRCSPRTRSSSRASRWQSWWRARSTPPAPPPSAWWSRSNRRRRSSTSPRRLRKQAYVQAPSTILRGDPDAALRSAPHTLSAEFSVGGQEHFYLEGQIAFALPGEDGDLLVHSSTQHPDRSAACLRPGPGLRLQSGDHGRAPPGRRVRRQGEQRLAGSPAPRRWPPPRPAGR